MYLNLPQYSEAPQEVNLKKSHWWIQQAFFCKQVSQKHISKINDSWIQFHCFRFCCRAVQAGSLSQESFDRNEKLFILSATAVLFPTLTSRNVCCENTWSSPTIFHWGGVTRLCLQNKHTAKTTASSFKRLMGLSWSLLASEHPQTTSIKIMSNWHHICKDLDEAELWHHRGWWKRENRGSTCFKKNWCKSYSLYNFL